MLSTTYPRFNKFLDGKQARQESLAGKRLSSYRLQRQLGKGAFAKVIKGKHSLTGGKKKQAHQAAAVRGCRQTLAPQSEHLPCARTLSLTLNHARKHNRIRRRCGDQTNHQALLDGGSAAGSERSLPHGKAGSSTLGVSVPGVSLSPRKAEFGPLHTRARKRKHANKHKHAFLVARLLQVLDTPTETALVMELGKLGTLTQFLCAGEPLPTRTYGQLLELTFASPLCVCVCLCLLVSVCLCLCLSLSLSLLLSRSLSHSLSLSLSLSHTLTLSHSLTHSLSLSPFVCQCACFLLVVCWL